MHRGPRSIPLCIQHHIQLTSLSFQVSQTSHSWVTAISIFHIENPRSRSWLMSKLKLESHKVGVTSYRLTSLSFHINRPSHSWDTAFSKFDLENPRSRSWVRWTLKSQQGSNILSTHIPLIPCQSAIPFLRYDFFKIWPWKSKVNVMGEENIESHKVGVTSYRLTTPSFHVNRPFHSWDTTFSKFDLENPRSMSNDHDVEQLQVYKIP